MDSSARNAAAEVAGAPARDCGCAPSCGKKTSATAGTIFHRSHSPLSTWFAAVWFVTSQKNGVSAQGLKDALGFGSYETAWAWLHKLRRAMVRPDRELLSGVVELDQSFVGGRATGKRGPSSDKAPITIAVERDERGRLGRVRLELADKPGGLDMIDFACEVVAPGAAICTDGARMFTRLTDKGYIHRPTPGNTAEDLDAVMPGPHLVSSLLKRWTAGTLHYRRQPPAPALLPRRIHLPIQPPNVEGAGHAVLPTTPAGRRHRPAPAQGTHRRLTCPAALKQICRSYVRTARAARGNRRSGGARGRPPIRRFRTPRRIGPRARRSGRR